MRRQLPYIAHKHAISTVCRSGAQKALNKRTICPISLSCVNAASGEAMMPFQGTSENDLKDWLEKNSIDTSVYGSGAHKSLKDLLVEVEKGESRLYTSGGEAERRIDVLNLLVSTPGSERILMEDFQLLPSGAVRKRGLPLSEKLLQGESWQEGIERAITEELGSILEPCTPIFSVKLTDYSQTLKAWVSTSYPQLKTISTHHTVPVTVNALPEEGFTTYEDRPGGRLEAHWIWVEPSSMT